jgi:hypothetical protein
MRRGQQIEFQEIKTIVFIIVQEIEKALGALGG